MRYDFLIITVSFITHSCCLTCNEVLELSSVVKLPLEKLQTIPPSEIVKCIADLSKYPLATAEADYIWTSIKTYFKDVQFIPPEVLMRLRWVTPAISPEEYSNMTIGDIDVIENFGLDYKLSDAQLSAIADRVRSGFAGKTPEDYTSYDLMALGNIICAFNRSEIERIHSLAYMETALMIGRLKRCSEDVMIGFATLATQPDAFGAPTHWDKDAIKLLGRVLKYVTKEYLDNRMKSANKNQNRSNGFTIQN